MKKSKGKKLESQNIALRNIENIKSRKYYRNMKTSNQKYKNKCRLKKIEKIMSNVKNIENKISNVKNIENKISNHFFNM